MSRVPRNFTSLASLLTVATERHSGLYSYPEQPWPPEKGKITVECKIHGRFEQRYQNHIRGTGCPLCWAERRGDSRRLSALEIEDSIKTLFPEYLIDASNYTNNKSKLDTICPVHGVFKATYNDLLQGHGCPTCGNLKGKGSRRSASVEKAKTELVRVHPDLTFPFLDDELTSTTALVTFICKKHGKGRKRPHKMLTALQGCQKCGEERRREKVRKPKEEIIRRFTETHGDTYDYSRSEVVGVMSLTTIVCKTHGEFRQSPQAHWSGQGCPACGVERRSSAAVIPFQEFLADARKVHGDRYEYVTESYGGTSKPITVICSVHGSFSQMAVAHLYGCGCPSCTNKGFIPAKKAHVYIYKIVKDDKVYVGFGISNNLQNRNLDHQKTFAEHGATGEIVAKFLYRNGALAAALESQLVSTIPITSTGMAGFIREAADWGEAERVLRIATDHHMEYKSFKSP